MRKQYSFKSKIIFTLLIVIVSVSFVSFYIYNEYLTKRIYQNTEENIVNILHLFKDQYYLTKHDDKSPVSLLKKMEENTWVLNIYLADSIGKVLYPVESKRILNDVLNWDKLSSLEQDVSIEPHSNESKPYSRIFLKMQNAPNCYECHDPKIRTLGYMVYDISMYEAEKNIAFTIKFSLFYTILSILIIGSVITLLHYNFVKKSLTQFQSKIKRINQGNLNERITIPHSKELGQLGNDFNNMLDSFQKSQKELQLYHNNELKNTKKLATVGEMAARLAHEIRNPITGIANAIEIIVDESQDEQYKPILEEIQRQANRVNEAVSNLLIYSHSKGLNKDEGNINILIKSLILFFKSQNHNKSINFQLYLQQQIPVFSFDHEQIENALMNLGLNAIQSLDDSGSVIFRTNYDDLNKEVIIKIEDTGRGIPNKIVSKIFNPFFTTRTEGTGLGLSIVKDVVEKHNGKIRVEQNVGKGSIFSISLPIEDEKNSNPIYLKQMKHKLNSKN